MADTPNYQYQEWLQEAHDNTSRRKGKMDTEVLTQLIRMNEQLARIIELLSERGRIQPS